MNDAIKGILHFFNFGNFCFKLKGSLLLFNYLIDFTSGCVGGIAGTIVGHPFETVKGGR